MSLFGSSSNNANPFGGSSFGGSTQNKSMFGSITQPQPPQQQQNTGFFGGSMNKPAATGAFGVQPSQSTNNNFYGGSTVFGSPLPPAQHPGQLNASTSTNVWTPPPPAPFGFISVPDQKSIPEQMADLISKWMPEQRATVFQHYFYNQVDPQLVPYYVAPADEDAKAWEEALSKKPNEGAIPVLGRGFRAVAGRLETQAKAVEALQARLHEMNNSLTEMLQKHDLEITVRTTEAKRKHIALTKRCLALATKAQILRNRGYAMDPREEELRKKLMELEKKAFDPMLNGRQEEVWARMSAVRARAREMQEDLEKIGKTAGKPEGEQLDEEHVKAIRKVLGDFDKQLAHLRDELIRVTKEWKDWQESNKPISGSGR
ncbi:Nucleoporin nup57 [Diplodia intermedia]|uniref:Nucleoporin nup57 n=1 Tax=Diplodia intermedia TaxID=856260 RepID=A0ABR3TQI0_9PEZI